MQKGTSLVLGCALLACGSLRGQNVFALAGANSNASNVAVLAANPFTARTSFNAGSGPFIVLGKPDGTKYYVIANSGSNTVTVVDSSFANPRFLGNFGQQAAGAALTPNGNRLLVAAGTLQIIDTVTDNPVVSGGVNVNSSAYDVAVSLDGTRAFVLGLNPAGGSLLTAVDLNQNAAVASLAVGGSATGVSVGPNGLVYVSTQNQLLEINPATLAVTQGGTIQLNARPGKVSFTPDGHFAVAANLTPITGSAALLFDLTTHTLSNTIPNFGVTLDRFLVPGNNSLLAYSQQTANLYQVNITNSGGFVINPLSISGVGNGVITAATLSNEVAGGGQSSAQYLFIAANGNIYRVDLSSNQVSGQVPSPNTVGALSYTALAISNVQPAALLQYGGGQTVAPNGTSLPIVARALDGLGRPVSGVTVTFAASNPNAQLQPPSAVTGADGFALTRLLAPASAGPVNITATAGTQTAVYTINVGSTSGGGGASAGLSIVAGQGQIVFENFNTGIPGFGSPLTVLVTDVNGQPAVNVPVVFSIAQGSGTILGGAATTVPGQLMVNTDSNGQASVNFLSTNIPIGSGYAQALVTANAPNTNTVTFYVTTAQQSNPPLVQVRTPQPGDVISGQAGSVIKGAYVIQVVSNLGQPIPNVSLRLVNPVDPTLLPAATCVDPTGLGILTDSTGVATCDLALNGKVGVTQVSGNVGYFNNTRAVTVQITPGAPSKIVVLQGNNQSGRAGQQLPLALLAQVSDAFGNILAGVPVTFRVSPSGGATLSNVSSSTDSSGRASALVTLGNTAGPVQVTLTAGTTTTTAVAPTATFNLTVNIPTSGIQAVSGGGQTALVNSTFGAPVVVKVIDAQGNGVAGVQVNFTVSGGNASIASPSVTTNSSGVASTTVSAGSIAGPITITATSGTFSTSFTLTSMLPGPANIRFVNGASFQSGISPGSIVTITGVGIAPGLQGTVTPGTIVGALPSILNGVQVLFNGIAAPIYSVSNVNGAESVTVQVPFELQPGTANVTINASGGGSATIGNVPVAQYSPGLFESLFNGQKLGVATRPDGSFVTPSNPALRGEVVCVFATGLGQLSPQASTNSTGVAGQSVLAPLDVGVNNAGVRLVSATYLPGVVGVYQVCLEIPSDTVTGPAQPIGLVVHDASGNAIFAQGTSIPIQ